MNLTTNATAAGPVHLGDGQRRELLRLIAANPDATCRELARAFEASTGRRIAAESVRRAWVLGYKAPRPDDRRRTLSEGERHVLLGLCLLAPGSSRVAIARKFELVTGRPIRPAGVRRALRRLGIADVAPAGRPRKAVFPC